MKFTPPYPLKSSVLFLVFNRLETTMEVFEAIRKAKPPRLYIAADGARENREGEKEIVQSVRDHIIKNIDWSCQVETLFRDQNLGCKIAVSSAIDWFFDREEMGIILEDDCKPSQSFFWFCEELLEKYKNDLRIWNIGGFTPPSQIGDTYSYNFSRFTHIWGWATWANRWKHYDVSISKYKENKDILNDYEFFRDESENKSRAKILDLVLSGDIDTWDYQWNFLVRINSGLSIRPKVSLVQNIGFGENATHTSDKNKKMELNRANNIRFPLEHPELIMVFKKDDELFGKRSFGDKLINKLKGIISEN